MSANTAAAHDSAPEYLDTTATGDSGATTQAFRDPAFMANRDAPVHRWVPWIAGFSKHFIEDALSRYTASPSTVLDPFAGVGTTLIEADMAGHTALGFEINPYAAFAARLKLSAHRIDTEAANAVMQQLYSHAAGEESNGAAPLASAPSGFRTRSPFYSARVERKVLLMLDFVDSQTDEQMADMVKLAFAATMVEYSNYSYEPSLGRRAAVGRSDVHDYPVAAAVADKLAQMAADANLYRTKRVDADRADGQVYVESFFDSYRRLEKSSVDLLITSPPYANNYHYNRNTRPQLYWLGFCTSPDDLRYLEEQNFGTYWQRAREVDHVALDPLINDDEIEDTVSTIRSKNPDRGIYGGSGWANYLSTYLNDCVRFATGMAHCLRSGATALVVIGNSIMQGVPVPTDRFLAKIARRQGLRLVDIHTPRATRVGNSIINSSVRSGKGRSTRLYESVVELQQQ